MINLKVGANMMIVNPEWPVEIVLLFVIPELNGNSLHSLGIEEEFITSHNLRRGKMMKI